MVNNITNHNNINHSCCKSQTTMVDNGTNNTNHFFKKPGTVMVDNGTNNTNHFFNKPGTVMVDNGTNNTNHFFNKPGTVWGFFFVQNFFCRTTRELEYFFSSEFNIRLYDKNSESDYFFSSTKIRIFFSATLGIR